MNTVERYLKIFLQVTLIVFLTYFLQNTLSSLDLMDYVEFNITIGSNLYLPLGSFILVTLLYRTKAWPGLYFICFLAGIYYELDGYILSLFTLINVLGPLLAIKIIEGLNIGFFKKFPDQFHLGQLLLLCIVASIINSLGKFFVYYYNIDNNAAIEDNNSVDFIASYISGDLMGSITFMLLALVIGKSFKLGALYIR